MRIRFADAELRRLYHDEDHNPPRMGRDLAKTFRKKVAILEAAESELVLRRMSSLNFKKLKGKRSGQHSVRLNDQWRLILTLDEDEDGKVVIVIEVVDYH